MQQYTIEETRDGFVLKQLDLDGETVLPWTTKPTAEGIIARLMQMMGVKEPVSPQDYPEQICLGEINEKLIDKE